MEKRIVLGLLLTAISASTSAGAAPGTTEKLGPTLAQVRTFSADEGERVWPGYGKAPFGFLLIDGKQEVLLCRDQVPNGFTAAGIDSATGCKSYARPRSGMPDKLLAAMPLFGPPSVIVMGTPQSTGRAEPSWIRTILHEHFHQWQYALPDYFARTHALDLHGGDTTGMWVLNYAFPYDRPEVIAAFNAASLKLSAAVAARGTPQFGRAFADYMHARAQLAAAAGEKNWRYFEFQLWQEGVARWTEIRLGKWYPRADVRETAARLEQATLQELANPVMADKKREVVYAYGTGEAMLIQACWPQWREEYPKALALGPLLDTARTRCVGGTAGERG
ncbi:MAG TPA: hypothetical protein VIL42_08730 [Sphingomicrobium sp.]|jgi:hypothetical protein